MKTQTALVLAAAAAVVRRPAAPTPPGVQGSALSPVAGAARLRGPGAGAALVEHDSAPGALTV